MKRSNFSFFTDQWSILANLGELAEKNVYTDPHTSLFKTRLFGETLSKFILAFENIEEPYGVKQVERINILKRNDILDHELINMLDSLRKIGNIAAHDYYGSEEEALTALRFAHRLGVWFMEVYVDYSFQAPTFQVPLRKEANADLEKIDELYEKKVKKLEQELESLRIEQQQRSEQDIKLLKDKRKDTTNRYLNQLKYTEPETRVLIDKQLKQAGWEVDTKNIRYSKGSRPEKGKNKAIAEWPCGEGIADYALFVGLELVGLVEAKRKRKDVMSDIEQAKTYAREVRKRANEIILGPYGDFYVPFLFATNGRPYIKQLEYKSGIWMLDARRSTNHSKPLQAWYSPQGLHNLLKQDIEKSTEELRNETLSYLKLRPYQEKAILAVEKAIEKNQRQVLIEMATGTGKTRMALGLIYRLIKFNRFKRILFLVDREALGRQAEDVFRDSRLENFQTFTEIFDLQTLKENHIPEEETKVQIATVQGMVKRLFYQDESVPTVDQYDCIIVDEAHRGYSLDREMSDYELENRDHQDYISKYRKVIDYFDAVKIGLTATPALHTVQIFGNAVFTYSYREAVVDGHLVDHEPPYQFNTELKKAGINWKIGEKVEVYKAVTGTVETEVLADDVKIDVTGFNKKVITENFNRVVLKSLSEYLDPDAEGKTVIFAATDDHADMIVRILKEEMVESHGPIDDSLIVKITGSIKDPSQMIKRFKNEKLPKIAVTVDLLSTGIDVPEISNIVFMRRIRSRILYEQMLGRATRLCPEINKTHFKIYDAVGLYEGLKPYTSIKPVVANPTVSVQKLVEELKTFKGTYYENDRKQELIAKIQRKKQHWDDQDFKDFQVLNDGQSLDEFIGWLKEAKGKQIIKKLKNKEELLKYLDENRERPSNQYISKHEDKLIGVTRGYGEAEKPDDYLESFHKFIQENMNLIPAIQVICTRPKELTRSELRKLALELDQKGFTEKNLQTAWYHSTNEEIAADIISFIRRYAIGDPLVSKQERIRRAMKKIYNRKVWPPLQKGWLEKIESQLLSNTILDPDPEKAFDAQPFKNKGGYKQLNKVFNGELKAILNQINEEMYKKEQA
ncbi:type I restriction-modification system endonuclease [Shimazuella alba]|uniref:Type I restriction-modification system endonuclease n=1 Tax=Shimazuella alba TaxID=2690964 RepID=A0A6I4VZD2_9BACL|nr:type I restriction-modification system endonuclease [Shimazuella alba]MXQ55310.1 type I restriction-modification system endonuclease [Shimazuella alba]